MHGGQAGRPAIETRKEVSMSTIARRSAIGLAVASLMLDAAAPAFALAAPTVFADGGTMTLDKTTGNYCLSEQVTGSRIANVTCQSKADWAKDGLTITSK
jgi:hypothetical protein